MTFFFFFKQYVIFRDQSQMFFFPSPSSMNHLVQDGASCQWTAFMYRHPGSQSAELGLEGRCGHLVVWLSGTEWSSGQVQLSPLHWYRLCVTWTHRTNRPLLYIDGRVEPLVTGGVK